MNVVRAKMNETCTPFLLKTQNLITNFHNLICIDSKLRKSHKIIRVAQHGKKRLRPAPARRLSSIAKNCSPSSMAGTSASWRGSQARHAGGSTGGILDANFVGAHPAVRKRGGSS